MAGGGQRLNIVCHTDLSGQPLCACVCACARVPMHAFHVYVPRHTSTHVLVLEEEHRIEELVRRDFLEAGTVAHRFHQ